MPKPSQEWRKALVYEQHVEVLAIALRLSRETTEEFICRHVCSRR